MRTLDLGGQMIALAKGKSTRCSALAESGCIGLASSLTLHPKAISFARWTSRAAASSPEPKSPDAHRAGEQLMASVSLTEVTKSFGAVEVLHSLSLEILHKEFLVLVGPSGCGKTTLLRMIAGLEDVTSGTIAIDGRVVNHLQPKDRDIAMVFQDYALYPHMTVRDNLAFGLRNRRVPAHEIAAAISRAARILSIEPLLDRRPHQLSGGQQQRVALGRCIVRNPKVFLFDEPLSNLDAQLRAQMRLELKELRLRVPTTSIFVTHDQTEAMTLGDRIVVMKDGVVQQVGTPLELYRKPER